jgi:Ca2+-dependent lipid-binding protein
MVSPDLFVAGVDLLEDALKSLSPAVVHSVKVSSLHQGTNPLRLLGIRYLPSDTDITLPPHAKSTHSVPTGLPSLSSHREGEEPGSYVNLEAEFSYRRLPPSSALLPPSSHQTASSSPGFLLLLGIGLVKKIVKFDIPVSVSLIGLHGTCRLRLQVIADPPFVGRIQFCLTKVRLPFITIPVLAIPLVSFFLESFRIILQGNSYQLLKSSLNHYHHFQSM